MTTSHTKSLPLLNTVMRLERATNEALAQAAGVSTRSVCKARAGKPIRINLADCICQALYEREFNY
jgi:DNA-binding Xre family transcriptional regulator